MTEVIFSVRMHRGSVRRNRHGVGYSSQVEIRVNGQTVIREFPSSGNVEDWARRYIDRTHIPGTEPETEVWTYIDSRTGKLCSREQYDTQPLPE